MVWFGAKGRHRIEEVVNSNLIFKYYLVNKAINWAKL